MNAHAAEAAGAAADILNRITDPGERACAALAFTGAMAPELHALLQAAVQELRQTRTRAEVAAIIERSEPRVDQLAKGG